MSAAAIPLAPHFANAAPVLAAGAWFKNALCGVKGGEGRMSRVVGDLNTPEACIAHEQEADTLLAWLGTPAAIAMTPCSLVGMLSWPLALSPQATTVPSFLSARL